MYVNTLVRFRLPIKIDDTNIFDLFYERKLFWFWFIYNKNFKKETIEDFLSLSPFRNEILSLISTTWFGI